MSSESVSERRDTLHTCRTAVYGDTQDRARKFKASGQAMRAGYSYHNHFWIPHDRDGTFEMKGLNGQHMHINPVAELVIIKLSSLSGDTSVTHHLDRRAFAAIAGAVTGH